MKKYYEKLRIWLSIRRERRIKKAILKKMIRNYEQNYQVEILLEEWIVKKILNGKVERRKELAEKQARIKEMSEFIEHLKKLKI